jgi:hypothetical protein
MLKKFNLFCEKIIKEYKTFKRIKLAESEYEFIKSLIEELRPEMREELEKYGDPRLDYHDCSGRFNDDKRQIMDIETYISDDKDLQEKILKPSDESQMYYELIDHDSILEIMKDLVRKALKEAASAEYYYRHEKDWE